MTEIEQLRKEVNELRERIAKMEAQHPRVVGPAIPGLPYVQPTWIEPNYYPPAPMPTITCGSVSAVTGQSFLRN